MRGFLFILPLIIYGCGKGTPVAPSGAILSMTVTPSTVPLNGEATVTVTAVRINGQPVNPGTNIFLSTTLGSIDSPVVTDERGVATAVFRAGSFGGQATITASSGNAEPVSVEVGVGLEIGEAVLRISPSVVPSSGGEFEVKVIVVDKSGNPLEGASVLFSSSVGVFATEGVVRSNSDGIAVDSLFLSAMDVANSGGEVKVAAIVSSGNSSVTLSHLLPVAGN